MRCGAVVLRELPRRIPSVRLRFESPRGLCVTKLLTQRGGARWKKVRAKVTISPHFETSARESEDGRRAEGAQDEEKGRKRRRVATKAEGDDTEKWAVLSLVSYLKYDFYF